MKQSFKYLTHTNDDEKWGLFLNVVGFAGVMPDEKYPPVGHPENYHFNWEGGRILDEFQLVYITKGAGVFETKTQKINVKEGNLLLIYPFVWHRYKPNSETGWTENYVGFDGTIAKQIMTFFPKEEPVRYIGFNDQVHQTFLKLTELAEQEKIGYQQIASSHLIFILSSMRQILLNSGFADNKLEKKINQSRLYMRENLTEQFSMEELAEKLSISYSSFRSEFKKYNGIPPGQYLLQLRIQSAKLLLSNASMTVKEIAFACGFESPFYFSKMFKKQVGTSPILFRKKGEENR